MAVSRYVTLRAIKHSGNDFAAGTPVALSDEYAAPLLAIGAIQAQAGALPVMPTIPGNVVREKVDSGAGGTVRTYVEAISLAGGAKFLVPGADPKLFQQRRTAYQAQGKAALSGTANASRHLSVVLPFRWYAVQAKVFNAHGSVTPTYNIGLATADNITDPNMSAEAWSLFKWGGEQNVIPPVASNSTPGAQTMGESDWSDPLIGAPKIYGDGTVMGLRSWADVSNNTWFDFDAECALTSTLDVQGIYTAWKANANAVVTPASFLSPQRSPAAAPPVLLRFLTSAMIKVHLLVGSSTTGGKGDAEDMGWAWRTQRVVNSLGGMAYHFVNYSHGGAPTTGNDLRLAQVIDDVNPDSVTINVFTLNDADRATADGLARLKARIDAFVETCKARGIPPSGRITMTWQHPTGSTGGEYANAKAINAYARAKATAGECVVFDVAAVLSDEIASVGTWKDPSDTTDGTHPNSNGHAKLVPVALMLYA